MITRRARWIPNMGRQPSLFTPVIANYPERRVLNNRTHSPTSASEFSAGTLCFRKSFKWCVVVFCTLHDNGGNYGSVPPRQQKPTFWCSANESDVFRANLSIISLSVLFITLLTRLSRRMCDFHQSEIPRCKLINSDFSSRVAPKSRRHARTHFAWPPLERDRRTLFFSRCNLSKRNV